MSKTKQDKRFLVSEAAWRVITREGLDRTSMRAIAQEMGCTTGVVTHYFRDKEALLLFALYQVTEQLEGFVRSALDETTGIERLSSMMTSFLPLDEQREDLLRIWIAFLGYAVGRPSLMMEHQKNAARLRRAILEELVALQASGIIRADIEPEVESNVLLALGNGISLDALIQSDRLSVGQQRQAILRYVDSLRPVGHYHQTQ